MADEAIAFAREWDAATQGARLAALYRELAAQAAYRSCSHTPVRQPMKRQKPVPEESPFKGQTGLRRIWNAFNYSLPACTPPIATKTPSARKACWPS
jgi:hypothetical protein